MPASRTWPRRAKVVLLGAAGAVALSTAALPARAAPPDLATTDVKVPASVGDPAVGPLTATATSAAADLCATVAVTAGFSSTTAVTAVAVALAESGCNPGATAHNSDAHKSYDRGLWQLNSYWHAEVADSCAYNAQCNANATFKISSRGADWTPWSTYSAGLYKNYLSAARTALSKVDTLTPAGPAMLYGASSSAALYGWTSSQKAFSLKSSRWTSSSFSVSATGNRVASGDFDGDGHGDVAAAVQAADGTFRIYVWRSGGTSAALWYTSGTFSLAPVAGRMVAGDFDGNGRSDLAFLRASDTSGAAIWRFLSTGSGFGAAKTWEVPSGYSLSQVDDRVVAGDFDGNGTADLAAAFQYLDGTFRVHVWKGATTYTGATGWYRSPSAFALSTVGSRMVAGDFDGAGKADIVMVSTAGTDGAALWRYLSSGSAFSGAKTWQVASGYPLANVAGRVAAGDADNDGKAELVSAYQYPDGTFRNHVWTSGVTYTGAGGWYASPSNFPLGNVADRFVMSRW